MGIEIPEANVTGAVTDTLGSDQYRLAAMAVLGRAVTLRAAPEATVAGIAAHGVLA